MTQHPLGSRICTGKHDSMMEALNGTERKAKRGKRSKRDYAAYPILSGKHETGLPAINGREAVVYRITSWGISRGLAITGLAWMG